MPENIEAEARLVLRTAETLLVHDSFLTPTAIVTLPGGKRLIVNATDAFKSLEHKAAFATQLHRWAAEGASGIILIMESWAVTDPEAIREISEEFNKTGKILSVSDHPKRVEVIMINASNPGEQIVISREFGRDDHGHPMLIEKEPVVMRSGKSNLAGSIIGDFSNFWPSIGAKA